MNAVLAALAHQAGRRGGLHVLRVFSRELQPAAAHGAPAAFSCRPLGTEALLAACADPALELREAMVRAALARGEVCVGAFCGEVLAGYVWHAYARAPHVDGVWVDVPARAVYRYKAFVRPEFRGRGLGQRLYRAADAFIARPGRGEVVSCVHVQNAVSLGASRASGDTPLGFLAYWQAGARFLAFHTPAVEAFGLRFSLA